MTSKEIEDVRTLIHDLRLAPTPMDFWEHTQHSPDSVADTLDELVADIERIEERAMAIIWTVAHRMFEKGYQYVQEEEKGAVLDGVH